MDIDHWSSVADDFIEAASASVKGQVRTHVLHQHLMDHLPGPPAAILDVGGGAGHQAIPLARAGFDVTLLDSSATMLGQAERRLASEPGDVRNRVRLLQAEGEQAQEATNGQRFSAVLCHGVLMYLEDPAALVSSLCECVSPGGLVSVMALNARTLAILPALRRRWQDALVAFDAETEDGVLGVRTRADTVEGMSELLRRHDVQPVAWYGVWLFADWMPLPGVTADEVTQLAAVELEASRRDPYRQLSRVFHLVGVRG